MGIIVGMNIRKLKLDVAISLMIVLIVCAAAIMCVMIALTMSGFDRSVGRMCIHHDGNDSSTIRTLGMIAFVQILSSWVLGGMYYHYARKWALDTYTMHSDVDDMDVLPKLPSMHEIITLIPKVFRFEILLVVLYYILQTVLVIIDRDWRSEVFSIDGDVILFLPLIMVGMMFSRLVVDYSYRLSKNLLLLVGGSTIAGLTYILVRAHASRCHYETTGVWIALQSYEFCTLIITIAVLKFFAYRVRHIFETKHSLYLDVKHEVLYDDDGVPKHGIV